MDLIEIKDAVDEYARAALHATGTPGGVLTIADETGDSIDLAYGLADVAAKTEMTPRHSFHAGSFSKMFVGLAVAQLAELDELDLHAPIDVYGVDVVNPKGRRPITLHDLLTHRAGLAVDTYDATLGEVHPDATELLSDLDARSPEYGGARRRWAYEVGERFCYSSAGLALAAEVVEQVTERSWPEHVARDITRPLGMTATAWPGRPGWHAAKTARMTGHMAFGDMCVPTPDIGSRTAPSTAMVTTAPDMAKFMVMLLREGQSSEGVDLITPEHLRRATIPRCEYTFFDKPIGMHMGRGIETRGLGTEREAIGHAGAYPYGWWSVAWAHPNLSLAVTAAGNAWDMRQYGYLPGTWPWLVADEVARLRAGGRPLEGSRTSAYVAGAVAAERIHGLLGVPGVMPEEEVTKMASAARPLPGAELPRDWITGQFHHGFRAMQSAATPEEIRARLTGTELGAYAELVGLRWGARSLMLDPNLGA